MSFIIYKCILLICSIQIRCRMGTHPSCPSKLKYVEFDTESTVAQNVLLSDYLHDKPEAVGHVPPGYDHNNLPFLFKVLSIRTALSIQVRNIF